MAISLILNILVAILLVVMIGYAVSLNRRLDGLRRNKAELEKLASTFGEATMRAGDSIFKLKSTADELQDRMDKAAALRDDLAFLIERGGSSADRLEDAVRAGRVAEGARITPTPIPDEEIEVERKKSPRRPAEQEAKSRAEEELLKALQSVR